MKSNYLYSTLLVLTLTLNANAAYTQLASLSELVGTTGATSVNSFVINGTTSYQITSGTSANYSVLKTTGLGGVKTTTQIITNAALRAVNGNGNSFSGATGFGRSSAGVLQLADGTSEAIYRINTTNNTISRYVSKADIDLLTGLDTNILAGHTVLPNGEHAFYDTRSDSFISTSSGSVSTTISTSALIAIAGNADSNGGITAFGTSLFWSENTNRRIYSYDTSTSTGSVALTTANITSVTGGASFTLGAMFAAPDNLIYFQDNQSRNVLSFDPTNAAASLTNVLTQAQLLAGPAGTSTLQQFGWYNDNLAFLVNTSAGGAAPGLYAIPEVSTFTLSLGALTLLGLRRRR